MFDRNGAMRYRFHLGFCVIALLSFGASARAQDAGKIIGQYEKAAGGSKALSKIRTLTIEGAMAASDGNAGGTYTFNTRLPNRYYSELIVGDRHFIEAYNGKSAWHEGASGTVATLLGGEAAQLEFAAQYYTSHLLDLKRNKVGAAFVGHAQVAGRDALQVELTDASGIKREVFFDAQSHLIAKESAVVGGIEQEILYDDYRPVDGIKLPYKIELHRGGDVYPIRVTRAAVNDAVGERVFDFPRSAQVELPDLKTLFKEIDANQKVIDKIKENYSGMRTEEETEYDGSGKVKKTDVNEYSFFYLHGREISSVTKRDGKPLTVEEEKKQTERVQKEIQEDLKRDAEKQAKEEKAQQNGEAKKENSDDVNVETFLRACQFVNPRHERFRGQDVLVFDFEPNPEFKPHKLAEKLVQKLAGVIWVDEKAHDVARLEAYFTGDVKIAGGLVANLQKGTSFVFEQAFVNNEVWLPTYEEAHVGVRVLLVKGFKVNEVTRYSDYKRFNVETLSKIGVPKQP